MCLQTSSSARGISADRRLLTGGGGQLHRPRLLQNSRSKGRLQINTHRSVWNALTSGANEESVKSSERTQTEKRLPFVIFRGKCSFLSRVSQVWKGGKKLVSVWRWIRFDKNALNAHKDSVSRPRWIPPPADKGAPSLVSTGGTYHSLNVTAPPTSGHSVGPKNSLPSAY